MTSFNLDNSHKGKLSNSSKEFRIFFLLSFTKELIKHYKISEISKLENLIKKRIIPPPKKREDLKTLEEEYGEMIPSILYREPRIVQRQMSTIQPLIVPSLISSRPIKRMYERISDTPLPPPVQNIKPVPTEARIDLGKLNQIIQNPEVMIIECNGPNEPLIVKGFRGMKTLNTTLAKEEISEIIKKFSETTRIPINEGVFKVAAGKFIISAIVSEVLGSRFIIKKMQAPQRF